MVIRTMRPDESVAVADLIHRSTNSWYQKTLGKAIFPGPPEDCRVFPEIYGSLDPGCCLVAEIDHKLAGSCFYHPRPTHVGIGIMNAAPEAAGQGVARALLAAAIDLAGNLPLRLVSSAMNLDSYSLYTRAGFAPVSIYQDMVFPDPAPFAKVPADRGRTRLATQEDITAMVDLEFSLSRIERTQDCTFFIRNDARIWHTLVHETPDGRIDGWLSSVDHPGCRMIGPGVAEDESIALALILAQLAQPRGGSPIILVPAAERGLVRELSQRGARNLEIHVSQVRGEMPIGKGIAIPSFLPESG
jgi:GNAT superfamily N-acetyltransferase